MLLRIRDVYPGFPGPIFHPGSAKHYFPKNLIIFNQALWNMIWNDDPGFGFFIIPDQGARKALDTASVILAYPGLFWTCPIISLWSNNRTLSPSERLLNLRGFQSLRSNYRNVFCAFWSYGHLLLIIIDSCNKTKHLFCVLFMKSTQRSRCIQTKLFARNLQQKLQLGVLLDKLTIAYFFLCLNGCRCSARDWVG